MACIELTGLIIADQFSRLRDGDRLWYENVFEGRELRELQQTSLSNVIERNTAVEGLQDNVFFFHAEVSGQVLAVTGTAKAQAIPAGDQSIRAGGGDRSGPNRRPAPKNGSGSNESGPNLMVGVAGVTVELLDDEGNIIETVVTDSRGNYRFVNFAETGDYQVHVLGSDSIQVSSADTLDAWVSTGNLRLRGLNFQVLV